jgi:hypothetical protein
MKNQQKYFYTSTEIKAILSISGCQLMHQRQNNLLPFIKKGNSFLYEMPAQVSVLQHPLGKRLINWYFNKHLVDIDNNPKSSESKNALELLINEILIPLERKFGKIKITYGFTSAKLQQYISKHSPAGTAPKLDQHSASELNVAGRQICERNGASCDIIIENYSSSAVVRYIVSKLNYDRIYFYGAQRPIHVSVSDTPIKHLQIMRNSINGKRYPAQKAFDKDVIKLAEVL